MAKSSVSSLAAERLHLIRALMPQALSRDRAEVAQRLERLGRGGPRQDSKAILQQLNSLHQRLEKSAAERRIRLQQRPQVSFPKELPITGKAAGIIRAIQDHRVLIISGETGCGKSTQIPKMCLAAGRGIAGKIGCTQPRRIAAVTIAYRIAEELGESIGRSIGYKIRFQDKTPRGAYIKIMTDGMLLAETQSDVRLNEYDTLIIDEAHERSLNIDFLLGISRTLLLHRPELKVIITSATLDTQKFSEAFDGAPVIQVRGRMYPVDVEYCFSDQEKVRASEADYVEMAVKVVHNLKKNKPSGDILIFMPTEQDILETCRQLERRRYARTSVLPLFARLPAAQQRRVYTVSGPKIVVATNVAETSLTIPGIRYVVDTGLARIAQYQPGSRINSLPISAISRSSADQRKGRCGRVQEGLCLRLYTQEDYESRLPFTPPEILRSDLAEVILRMINLKLGHPMTFPFLDRPNPKTVKDGYDTLLELGAIKKLGRDPVLTEKGRIMALVPLDPRISRMLLEAQKQGCIREVVVLAAALSIRDPRERPPEKAALADHAHTPFVHTESDFLTLLKIWNWYHGQGTKPSSQRQKRKLCRDYFLSYARMREWADIHGQILGILADQNIPLEPEKQSEAVDSQYAGIHKAVSIGFLSNTAVRREKNLYSAAKNRDVMLFPGSGLFNGSAPWIVAAEMVRTSRLFARTAAKIDPCWLEELGGELCRYSHSEPYWDEDRGEVRAKERVTLFGLEIVSDRRIPYSPLHPEKARALFVHSALVQGRIKHPPSFLEHNLKLIRRLRNIEAKLRRRDILVNVEQMTEFYSKRLPKISDLRGLEILIKERGGDDFLRMREEDLLRFHPTEEELLPFPDEMGVGDLRLKTSYRFVPGEEDDGVTLQVPSSLLSSIPGEALEWTVPGLLREKIEALVKGLPKRLRKKLVPVSETAEVILKEMGRPERSLHESLSDFVEKRFRIKIPLEEWAQAEIPRHLKMRVAVIDHEGQEIGAGRDLKELLRSSPASAVLEDSAVWKNARDEWEKTDLTSWDFGDLPESIRVGPHVVGYPGLEPAAGGTNLRLFPTPGQAVSTHKKGVQALLLLRFEADLEFAQKYLLLPEEYASQALYFGGKNAVEKALRESLKREVFQKNLRTEEEFEAYSGTIVNAIFENGHRLREIVVKILDAYHKTRIVLSSIEKTGRISQAVFFVCARVREDLDSLMPRDFLEVYAMARMNHLPRYLEAIRVRAERGRNDPLKSQQKTAQVEGLVSSLQKMTAEDPSGMSEEKKEAIQDFRWMIEEFKVALFAPELKTAYPISTKRLHAKQKEIESLL